MGRTGEIQILDPKTKKVLILITFLTVLFLSEEGQKVEERRSTL